MEPDRVSAFIDAYERHSDAVRRAAQEVVRDETQAEDVAHEVFIALWRHPERYDADRGGLGAYLRLMARSRALDALRAAGAASRARARLEGATTMDDRFERSFPTEALEHAPLRTAVRSLPRPQREAVALVFWGGYTSLEISRRCELPLGTVKSRVRLGLRRLREDERVAAAS
jgi:RNA polymerase sigma-70 factor (ECF subfamily)